MANDPESRQGAAMTSMRQPEDGALRSDLSFAYRLFRPEEEEAEPLILLHGSAADEQTLVPLGREIAPGALLIAVRGRTIQDGGIRWFTRLTPTDFEQESIRTEAEAFAGFIVDLAAVHDFDLSRTTFLGYSNGANLVSSTMLLHSGLIRRAVLLRAMPVLDDAPAADLSNARALVIAGTADTTYAPFASSLVALLRRHGAEVEARTVSAGHEFGAEDAMIVRRWLSRPAAAARAQGS